MRPRNTKPNKKTGKVHKTFNFDPATYRKAEAILKTETRPRSLTALIEDLWDAEYEKVCQRERAAA